MTTSPSNDIFNGIQSPESIQFDFKHASPTLMPQVNFSMPIINFQTQIIKQNKMNQLVMGVEGALKNKQNLLIDTNSKNFVNQQFVGNFQNLLTPQSEQNQQMQIQNGGQSILQKLQNQRMNKIHQINSEMKVFKPNIKSSQIVTPHRRGIEDDSQQQQNINFNINQTYDNQTKSDHKNLNNVLISRPIKLNKLDKLSQAEYKIQLIDGFEQRNNFKLLQQPQIHSNHSLNTRNVQGMGMGQNASEKILPFSNQPMLKGGNMKFKSGNYNNEITIINQQNQFIVPDGNNNNQKDQHLQVMGETQRLSNGDSSKNQSGYQISLLNADEEKKPSEIGEEVPFNQKDVHSKGYTYDIVIQSAKSNFDN